MPVVIIYSWSVISMEFLQVEYEHIQKGRYDWSVLYAPYWKNLIENLSTEKEKI